jgi:hypothetical protein
MQQQLLFSGHLLSISVCLAGVCMEPIPVQGVCLGSSALCHIECSKCMPVVHSCGSRHMGQQAEPLLALRLRMKPSCFESCSLAMKYAVYKQQLLQADLTRAADCAVLAATQYLLAAVAFVASFSVVCCCALLELRPVHKQSVSWCKAAAAMTERSKVVT